MFVYLQVCRRLFLERKKSSPTKEKRSINLIFFLVFLQWKWMRKECLSNVFNNEFIHLPCFVLWRKVSSSFWIQNHKWDTFDTQSAYGIDLEWVNISVLFIFFFSWQSSSFRSTLVYWRDSFHILDDVSKQEIVFAAVHTNRQNKQTEFFFLVSFIKSIWCESLWWLEGVRQVSYFWSTFHRSMTLLLIIRIFIFIKKQNKCTRLVC